MKVVTEISKGHSQMPQASDSKHDRELQRLREEKGKEIQKWS